jgi:CHASE2 domain-containing sensor protein
MSISPSISLPPTPKALLDLIKLEAGPAPLPASRLALWISLGAYVATEAGGQLVSGDILPSIAYGVVSAALLAALTFGALTLAGARDRFQQTLVALASTGAIIGLVSMVLSLAVAQIFPPPMPAMKLVAFVLFPLVLWKFTVFLWIFRHASLRFIPAFALSAIYIGFMLLILSPLLVRLFGLL